MSEPSNNVTYQVRDSVARLTLDRPERRNAMTYAMIGTLRDYLARAKSDVSVRTVLLQGAGEVFCAGIDLGGLQQRDDFLANHRLRGAFASVFEDLWTLGKPTVAQVRGFALAGGFGLALACDVVIASENARFGAPEINVGMWPHMITTVLTRAMAPKAALELIMSGRIVDAAEGLRLGFLHQVVPDAQLDGVVDEYAAMLAAKSPAAMSFGRDTFYSAWDMSAPQALALFRSAITVSANTEDAAEGIAAFLEKRPPSWSGR